MFVCVNQVESCAGLGVVMRGLACQTDSLDVRLKHCVVAQWEAPLL